MPHTPYAPRRYWTLSPEQDAILRQAVAGREVWDMGAGSGTLAALCAEYRASSVVAVDHDIWAVHCQHAGVRWLKESFVSLAWMQRDTIVISWPVVLHMSPSIVGDGGCSLTRHARLAKRVIVLAQTYGGTMCGSASLWNHLSKREVLASATDPRNDMVVYGDQHVDRLPLPVEAAGMDMINIHAHFGMPPLNRLGT